jgi:FkbM family methyltransferase
MTSPDDVFDHAPEHPEEIWVKKEFGLLVHRLQQLPPASRARLQGRFVQELVNETLTTETPRGPLSFVLLGRAAGGRALNLLTKQPATITWIESFRPGSVFWDVGANVGTYTLYAALASDTTVVAFEPAAVNYYLLAANCEANNVDERVHCLLLGLGKERGVARLEVSQFDPARSFSFRGKKDRPHPGRQAALILPMDHLIEEYQLACPNYIKIDVPGMTEPIIEGGTRLLRRPEVREVHIELREHSAAGQRITGLLEQSGFAVASRDVHGGSADVTFARPGR